MIVSDVSSEIPTPEGVDGTAWASALAAARAYCGWHIAPVITEEVTLDAKGSTVVVLPTLHVKDVLSVTDRGVVLEDPEWSQDGMVKRGDGRRFSDRYRGVTVAFKHGYEQFPAEVAAVLVEAASRGVGSPVAQVGQVRYGGDGMASAASFMMDQRKVLDRYRRGRLA